MSKNYRFDYSHLRNRKARLASRIDNPLLKNSLIIIAIASLIFGFVLLFLKSSFAWYYFALNIILACFLYWRHAELSVLPNRSEDNINNILSFGLASCLPKNLDVEKLIDVAMDTNSGIFLVNRYGILPQYLKLIVEHENLTLEQIFEKAFTVREKTESEHLSGAVVTLAIIELFPNPDQFLNKLKLDIDDLYDGVNWFNYLHNLIKGRQKTQRTGGLGRDLSFGYTPLLQRFAQNISQAILSAHLSINQASSDEIINEMIKVFSSGGRQNIALVGAEGSGRKTIVYSFATKLLNPDNHLSSRLQYRQIFKLDAATLISVASERGRLENLMLCILNEAHRAKNIILWLDNAQLFFEEGVGSVDLTKILLPIIQGGRLRLILTMEEQSYLKIEAKNSQFTSALNKIRVPPSTPEETMDIMQDRVPFIEAKHDVVYTIWALKEAYALSEKYLRNMVMPGRALSLLEAAAPYADKNTLVTAESVQIAVEKTYGVRMQASQNEQTRQELLDMEQLIHGRMVGQDIAVKAVANALRRSAAGVRNENHPIGTFLFLGPTGVGKTELAKTISEVYFHGEGNIVRLDLNEFVEESSVYRLIADAATDERSLTAQITSNPFSVVLLDEIEKAHPKVLTALLQLLDEGVLRDEKNHDVSFRDTIVIATSNAGADQIRSAIERGENLTTLKEVITNKLIDSGEFKAEFLNRFDEICIFTSLSYDELAQIFERIIAGINQSMQDRKISVSVDTDARDLLLERGYDPKLGARPLRRVVASSVENIVAKAILADQLSAGGRINITKQMIEEEV